MTDRRNLTAVPLTALAFLLAAAAGAAQGLPAGGAARGTAAAGAAATKPGAFRLATPAAAGPGWPSAFDFELSGHAYHVRANGAGRRTGRGPTRLFNLRLEGIDAIRSVFFAEYEGNVLLVCEVSDGQTGAAFAVRLEQPSMRARWRLDLPAGGAGRPAVDGASLYVTARGFAARVDLGSGKYVWSHEDLAAPGGPAGGLPFEAFDVPEVSGEEVLFRELPVYNRAPRVVRVGRRTGRILGFE